MATVDILIEDASSAVDRLQRWAPLLRGRTEQTASSFALYKGPNDAFLATQGQDRSEAALIADRYRMEAAMLAIIFLYSLFDRNKGKVSFQHVKALLARADVQEELVRRYSASGPGRRSALKDEARRFIAAFVERYAEFDVLAYGRLKHFRNLALAHLTEDAVSEYARSGELEALTRLACALQKQLSLLAEDGLNTHAEQHIGDLAGDLETFWRATFRPSFDPHSIDDD